MSSTDIVPRGEAIEPPSSVNPNEYVFLTGVVANAWFSDQLPDLAEGLADDAISRGLVDVLFVEERNTSALVRRGTRVTLWSEDLAECFHTTA